MAVQVLTNGMETEFYCKCSNCASKLKYKFADTKQKAFGYTFKQKFIVCPICKAEIDVYLLTEEEYNKNYPYWFSGVNCCGTGIEKLGGEENAE